MLRPAFGSHIPIGSSLCKHPRCERARTIVSGKFLFALIVLPFVFILLGLIWQSKAGLFADAAFISAFLVTAFLVGNMVYQEHVHRKHTTL